MFHNPALADQRCVASMLSIAWSGEMLNQEKRVVSVKAGIN